MGFAGLSALSFLAPLALLGLLALPALWWLLRATPPQPVRAYFPPLEILRKLEPSEQTPDKTPWWLLLLRLLLAAALIIAFAGPQWRASERLALPGDPDGPLLIVMESDWASAHNWSTRLGQAEQLIRTAERADRPVGIIAFPQPSVAPPLPADAAAMLAQLDTLEPHPAPLDRHVAADTVAATLSTAPWANATVVWMTSGLGSETDGSDGAWLSSIASQADIALVHGTPPRIALSLDGGTDGPAALIQQTRFDETSLIAPTPSDAATRIAAFDNAGRQIANVPLLQENGQPAARISFDLPPDVRNDIARIAVLPALHAGHVLLIDDRSERRQVAIVGGERADQAQPLLSAATFLQRAIQQIADLRIPRTGDGNSEVRQAIASGADVIIIAGSVSLVPTTVADLEPWIERGGVLIRFASAGLAANPDNLLPVPLRAVDRQFGGALTWEQPQTIAPFRGSSPFAGLTIPQDILIERQVLSEPGTALASNTFAELADATPLVTGQERGNGHLVLFHVTADTSWSNLPLSGLFVSMLTRLIELSVPNGTVQAGVVDDLAGSDADVFRPEAGEAIALNPRQTISAFGTLAGAPSFAEGLILRPGQEPSVSPGTPPGFYGPATSSFALNLFQHPPDLVAASVIQIDGMPIEALEVDDDEGVDLRLAFLFLAALFAIMDTLIVLALSGGLLGARVVRQGAGAIAVMIVAGILCIPTGAIAQNAAPGGLEKLIAASNQTRFAYVITGDAEVDQRSRQGIEGISRILTQRTAFEPASPFGIDPVTDELSVYPLLYWPMPTVPIAVPDALVERIDAYMNNGGTILFDTRDEAASVFSNAVTPQTANLRALLSALDIPPLEPVPGDHVLTKSFYLIDTYPGRYSSGPLWVEALPDVSDDDGRRPARGGDGVSPIMITSNDFASAWALSDDGRPLYATSPPNPLQREFAFRTGVNIAMYIMTGNYKADQVHIPALLERLIQ